jgi:hypothetical protein
MVQLGDSVSAGGLQIRFQRIFTPSEFPDGISALDVLRPRSGVRTAYELPLNAMPLPLSAHTQAHQEQSGSGIFALPVPVNISSLVRFPDARHKLPRCPRL